MLHIHGVLRSAVGIVARHYGKSWEVSDSLNLDPFMNNVYFFFRIHASKIKSSEWNSFEFGVKKSGFKYFVTKKLDYD